MKQKKYLIEAEVEAPYVRSEIKNMPIKATSADEAILLCKKELKSQDFSVNSVSKRASVIPGIVFLTIAFLMTFVKYYEPDGFNYVDLFPSPLSILFSIIVYVAFVVKVKGIENTLKNATDTIISVLFILVFATFMNIFTNNAKVSSGIIGKILGKIGLNNTNYLIVAAIVLSWLGIKQIASFVWIAIILLGITELITCGNYMGNFKGMVFLLSSFLGFVFYLKYEGKKIINSFRKLGVASNNFIKSNINESGEILKKEVNKAKNSFQQNKNKSDEILNNDESRKS